MRTPIAVAIAMASLTVVPTASSGAQRIAPVAVRRLDAGADWPAGASPGDTASRPAHRPGNMGMAIAGGVVGGSLGVLVGGIAGAMSQSGCHGEECSVGGLLVGGAIGESIGLALGVRAGSPDGGNTGTAMLASFGVLAGGVLVAAGTRGVAAPVLFAVPAVQIWTVLAMER